MTNIEHRLSPHFRISVPTMEFHNAGLTAIIGSNGSGKTSVMKLLSGFIAPEQGQVLLHDKAYTEYSTSELAKYRALIAQKTNHELDYRGAEIIEMGSYHLHLNKTEQSELHSFLNDEFELHGLMNKSFRSMSGGEQQRILLAQSVAQLWRSAPERSFLFLDEPTNNLDLYHQEKMLQWLKKQTKRGLGVICILHDLNQVLRYADHVYALRDGQLVHGGKPEELLTESFIYEQYQLKTRLYREAEDLSPQLLFTHH